MAMGDTSMLGLSVGTTIAVIQIAHAVLSDMGIKDWLGRMCE